MSLLPAAADSIRCIAMPERTLLLSPYSVRRQTLQGVKSSFLPLVPQNMLRHSQLFSQQLCTLKAQAAAGLE